MGRTTELGAGGGGARKGEGVGAALDGVGTGGERGGRCFGNGGELSPGPGPVGLAGGRP